MALVRNRGARRYRNYVKTKRVYDYMRKEQEEFAKDKFAHEHHGLKNYFYYRNYKDASFYLANEGRKNWAFWMTDGHHCGDCCRGGGCDWYYSGTNKKYMVEKYLMDLEAKDLGIQIRNSKPNRTWIKKVYR